MVGSVHVPAGSYTLFTMPTKDGWWLIINKQTGQWGLTYDEKQDLGRTKLMSKPLAPPQELLSITVTQVHGPSGELHIKWADQDLSVHVMTHAM